jgi:hypothetical protein
MKNLLILILILSSTSTFSYLQDFEIKDLRDMKQKMNLKLIAARICYDKAEKKNEFVMYGYLGGNRAKEFYNSCAVVKYKLSCLGKIIPSYIAHGKMFCDKPMKFNLVESTVLFKSFSDKFKCKKIFNNKIYETRKYRSGLKCYFSERGEKIDEIVDFNEDK